MKVTNAKNLKKIGVDTLNKDPLVLYFHGVFSDKECDDVINEKIEYQQCTTYFNEPKDNIRTSDVGFSEKGELINNNISKLTNQKTNKMEIVEILRYKPGQKFNTHYDYLNINPSEFCTNNDRVATAIAYLNDDFEGGTTIFPKLGIEIKPQKGSVLYFEYDKKSNRHKTIHSGEEVTKGVKYIAVTCIRGDVFDPYNPENEIN
jgi:prolyl 4-hydroxylase